MRERVGDLIVCERSGGSFLTGECLVAAGGGLIGPDRRELVGFTIDIRRD